MDKTKLKEYINKLLSISGSIKARQLAIILSKEFGLHVDRSDVNSVLYSMQKEGVTKKDKTHQWSLCNVKKEELVVDEIIEPTITFTPEQESVINLDPKEHLLIRGQAGSGKTTVLAARAGYILSAMNNGSLLFLTYNAALCSNVERAFKKAGVGERIEVKTFHDWARNTSKLIGYEFEGWVTTKSRSEKLRVFIKQAKNEFGEHRLYNLEENPELITWWNEEIAWLFGQHVTRLDEYILVERIGRGNAIRLSSEDRKFVWFIYEEYQEWLEESHQEDYDNPAGLILRSLMETNSNLPDEIRYDHVFIDEVQDFDRSWLLAIVQVAKVSLTLAGDLAQKIYKRNFSWNSVGIQVRGGRSRKLAASHRTTKQIMDVANYLLVDNDITKSEDYVAPVMPKKNDVKVNLIMSDNAKEAYEQGYDWISKNYKFLRAKNVAVALPFSNQLYLAKKALEKRGVTAILAKGKKLGVAGGGIIVTTYHQLKGLEFNHVVIMGLYDSQYPGRILMKIPEEDKMQEEQLMRRVLYVAMTRAKNTVTLVGSDPFCRFFSGIPKNLFNLSSE